MRRRTIRNPRIERRAVRAAQLTMNRRPAVGTEFWRGVRSGLLIIGGVGGSGLLMYLAMGGTIK